MGLLDLIIAMDITSYRHSHVIFMGEKSFSELLFFTSHITLICCYKNIIIITMKNKQEKIIMQIG